CGVKKSFGGGGRRGFQDQGETVPPIEKPIEGHSASAAIGVVGVDDLHGILGKVNERDNVSAGTGIEFAKANHRAQAVLHRVAQNRLVSASWVLNAVRDIRVRHGRLEV